MENMNKDIKAFFIDLDGTTFDTKTKEGQHWVSNTNLDAIKKAREEGKHVVISTGRVGVNLMKYFDLIGGDYAISGNGARIIDAKGKTIQEYKLSIQQVLKITEVLQRNSMVMKVDDEWKGYGAFTWLQKTFSKKFGFMPIEGYHFEMHKPRLKIVTWGKVNRNKISKIKAELEKCVENISVVSSANGFTLEITHADATKGKAAKFVCEKLIKVDPKHAAHVGDSMNDSTVIGELGRLIAMNNGHSELKKLTSFITANSHHHGLAKALQGDYKNKSR